VLRGAFTIREEPGRLDHEVHAKLTPRELGRVALRQDPEVLAVDGDAVLRGGDVGIEHSVGRVVLEHVREDRRVGEVVHRRDPEIGLLLQVGPVEVPPDPAEAVDANLGRHSSSLVAVPPRS
jgi:hypothetical protein